MEKTCKISEVSDYKKEWTSQYGTFVTYYVKVSDFLGVVELNKKPDSPAPQAGEEITGTFTKTDYVDKQGNDHYKFKASNKFNAPKLDLSDVHAKLDKIIALLEKPATKPQNAPDEVIPVDGGEDISLSDIPF